MTTTGIVRKIDELGRIVLPKELRKSLNINSGDDFQITVNDKKIILEKFSVLENIENKILNVIDCFSSVNNYHIYISINNKLIQSNECLDNILFNKVLERKIIINDVSNKIKVSNNIFLYDKNVIFPIVINSDLLGCIIIEGIARPEELLSTAKIIFNLIKFYLVNN